MDTKYHKMTTEYPPDGGIIFYCPDCGRMIAYDEDNKRELLQQGDFSALHIGMNSQLPGCDLSIEPVIV